MVTVPVVAVGAAYAVAQAVSPRRSSYDVTDLALAAVIAVAVIVVAQLALLAVRGRTTSSVGSQLRRRRQLALAQTGGVAVAASAAVAGAWGWAWRSDVAVIGIGGYVVARTARRRRRSPVGSEAVLPTQFGYVIRSARVDRAAAVGLRAGLDALAVTVLLHPVLLLSIAMLSTNSRLASGGPVSWAIDAASPFERMLVTYPFTYALAVIVLPLCAWAYVHTALRAALTFDARDQSLETDTPPALYLRAWPLDDVMLWEPGLRPGVLSDFSLRSRVSLTEVIARSVELAAPLVATAEPGGGLPTGVGSVRSTDQEWRTDVQRRAEMSLCVVMGASTVLAETGFAWEMDLVGAGTITDRVLVVLPPGTTFGQSAAADGFLAAAVRHDVFIGLADFSFDDRILVVARGRTGVWRGFEASDQTAADYHLCISSAVSAMRAEWEADCLKGDGPTYGTTRQYLSEISENRFVRDTAVEFGNNSFAAQLGFRIIHRVMRSPLGRVLDWIERKGIL